MILDPALNHSLFAPPSLLSCPPGGGAVVLGAESRASGDVAIDMMDTRASQQLQLIDEQVGTGAPWPGKGLVGVGDPCLGQPGSDET